MSETETVEFVRIPVVSLGLAGRGANTLITREGDLRSIVGSGGARLSTGRLPSLRSYLIKRALRGTGAEIFFKIRSNLRLLTPQVSIWDELDYRDESGDQIRSFQFTRERVNFLDTLNPFNLGFNNPGAIKHG